jgi:8-oxo-dGTP diphosphatase
MIEGCKGMVQKPFFLCVDGVIRRGNKMLLLKRQVEPFRGCWSFVGGHVDADENVRDALKREFKEETGLEVTIGKLAGCRVEETFDRIKIILTYEVSGEGGEIRLNEENQEYGWFIEAPADSVFTRSLFTLLMEDLTAKIPKK